MVDLMLICQYNELIMDKIQNKIIQYGIENTILCIGYLFVDIMIIVYFNFG